MMCGRGQVTLSGGQATVAHPRIPGGAMVLVERQTLIGTAGELMQPTVTPKVGFTVTSASPLDNSVVSWLILV